MSSESMSAVAFKNPERGSLKACYGSIHIPDFEVQAFTRNAPDLRRLPFAVLDPAFPVCTVLAANRFARQMGIRNGMTQVQLDQYSGVQVRHRSRAQEESAHDALIDCARHFTPRVERTTGDTLALDLSGLSGLWGNPRSIAQKLFQSAAKFGLEAHVAIASNPDAAILAARAKSGITVIVSGDEAVKLEDLPLEILFSAFPSENSEDFSKTLDRWGLRTFKDLVRLPAIQISERLGPAGVHLQRMARGEIHRPLRISKETLNFKESLELTHSIDSIEPLTFILSRLVNQLCERLKARNRTTNALHLELELEARPRVAFQRTIRLAVPIRNPKTLLKLLALDLETHRPPAPVLGVTLLAEPVEPRRIQNGLFLPETPDPEKLELTLAEIGRIVGPDNLGSPVLLDTHRRHAFDMKHFHTQSGSSHGLPSRHATSFERVFKNGSAAVTALRISRPSQPITVELYQGRPGRILFAGKTAKVIAAAGPWNASGDWWREDAWTREEWDVEIEIGWRRTLYRIYRDPRRDCWFIDAMYD